MPDPDSHEPSTPWRLVAITTIVVGTAMLVGPPASARGLAAVSALVLVALILFAVSRPSPARPDDAAVDPWIVLCNCPNVQAAFFVRAALEGSQIESLIPDEHIANMRSELVTAIGGVRVWVRASDFDRASDLLASAEPRERSR